LVRSPTALNSGSKTEQNALKGTHDKNFIKHTISSTNTIDTGVGNPWLANFAGLKFQMIQCANSMRGFVLFKSRYKMLV